ncbi:Protein of unknown function [Gryllus bimaculatus]|nr:Protein of unknown function [Gryllus bimaculatus]
MGNAPVAVKLGPRVGGYRRNDLSPTFGLIRFTPTPSQPLRWSSMCSLAAMPADYEMLVSHSPPRLQPQPRRSAPLSLRRHSARPRRRPVRLRLSFALLQQQAATVACPVAVAPPAAPPTARAGRPRPRRRPPPPAIARGRCHRRPCSWWRPEEAGAAHNGPPATTSDGANGDLPSPTRLKNEMVVSPTNKGLALTQVSPKAAFLDGPPMSQAAAEEEEVSGCERAWWSYCIAAHAIRPHCPVLAPMLQRGRLLDGACKNSACNVRYLVKLCARNIQKLLRALRLAKSGLLIR